MLSRIARSQGISTDRSCRLLQIRTYIDHRRLASVQPPSRIDRLAEYTRDEQINTELVRLKDENGSIGQPQTLQCLLRNIDRKTHTVLQLSKNNAGDTPIVQIVSTIDLLKRVREKEERARQQERAARDKKPKQIELNWAISGNDLDLKLKQMETFLEKGKQVEILLAAKKRQRKATFEEGTAVLNKVREKIEQAGAKEVKMMSGAVLKQAMITVKKE